MKKQKIEINKPYTLDEGYDEFILSCKVRNLRESTIKSYDERIRTIYKFINPKTPIESINKSTVDSFILFMQNELNIKEITMNTYLRAFRTILYYFMKMGYMKDFKISELKYDKPLIELYTDAEIKILLKKPNKNKCNFSEFRNWVICNVLYGTGIRCANILNLKNEDIDLQNNLMYLRTTKNRKPLILPICKSLHDILKEYMLIRKGSDDDYLFCSQYGNKMTRNSITSAMRLYNHNRGIVKTGIHRWRHSFTSAYIKGHGDVFKLQKILNHNTIQSTQNYVHLFTNDLQTDMQDNNPLEKILNTNKSIKMR